MKTINQEDKPEIIEKILKYYREHWKQYAIETLVEQTLELQNRPEQDSLNKMNKEELVNLLVDGDRIEMKDKAYLELKSELNELENITF